MNNQFLQNLVKLVEDTRKLSFNYSKKYGQVFCIEYSFDIEKCLALLDGIPVVTATSFEYSFDIEKCLAREGGINFKPFEEASD